MRKTSILALIFTLVLACLYGCRKEIPENPDPGTDPGVNPPEVDLRNAFTYNDEVFPIESVLFTIDEAGGRTYLYLSPEKGINTLEQMLETETYLYISTESASGRVDFNKKGNELQYRDITLNSAKISDFDTAELEFKVCTSKELELHLDITAKNGNTLKSEYTGKSKRTEFDQFLYADYRCSEVIQSYFTGTTPDNAANYYLTLSTVPYEMDDQNNIVLKEAGYLLSLDFYTEYTEGNPLQIPAGVYKKDQSRSVFTYNPEYTAVFKEDGNGNSKAISLSGDVIVEKEGEIYTISTTFKEGKHQRIIAYRGKLDIKEYGGSQSGTLPLIGEDTELKGFCAEATYFGNILQSDTGMMTIVVKDQTYQEQDGQGGLAVSLTVFTQLFPNTKGIYILPGTYQMSEKFEKKTWLPGVELDAMGMIVPFGTYVQLDDGTNYGQFSWAESGSLTIDEAVSGYKITYDFSSTDGRRMTGTFEGDIPIIDASNDENKDDGTSTLEDDHDMDLSAISTARLFPREDVEGLDEKMYSHYRIDIGSRGGWDMEEVLQKGDIFSMDLIVEKDQAGHIVPGEYQVSPDRFPISMHPNVAIRGHFAPGGEFDGTTWMHFNTEKNDLYMDGHVCAYGGSIIVEKSDLGENYYTFTIDVICVRKMHVRGTWTGPVINGFDNTPILPASK